MSPVPVRYVKFTNQWIYSFSMDKQYKEGPCFMASFSETCSQNFETLKIRVMILQWSESNELMKYIINKWCLIITLLSNTSAMSSVNSINMSNWLYLSIVGLSTRCVNPQLNSPTALFTARSYWQGVGRDVWTHMSGCIWLSSPHITPLTLKHSGSKPRPWGPGRRSPCI